MKNVLIIISLIITVTFTSCLTKAKYPTVESVTISPETVNITPGSTQDFTASVIGKNNPPQTVIWSITGTTNPNTTISQNGVLNIAENDTSSNIMVKSTSTFDKDVSGNANILIPTITEIIIDPPSVNVSPGESQAFTAVVIGINDPPTAVTWSITGNHHSSTNIDSRGILTVNADETASPIIVKATSTYNPSVSGTLNVIITGTTVVTSVNVTPSIVNIASGYTQIFTAVVDGAFNPPQTVTWSISGHNHTSTTINNDGILMVNINETSTNITVQATSTFNTNVSGYSNVSVYSISIGSIIPFGIHNWRVLAIENNKALIISQNVLEQGGYNTTNTNITWENSSLRTYLNGPFYNMFSESDKVRIELVTNQNLNNPTYDTLGGNPTQDRIFLLSIAEAQLYFSSNIDRVATYNGNAVWWWMRSPGLYGYFAASVYSYGTLNMNGNIVDITGGIRPALWLILEKELE